MIKCVKGAENLTVGKLYKCCGLAGSHYYVVVDNSGEYVSYLPDYFEMKNGVFVAYDENGNVL